MLVQLLLLLDILSQRNWMSFPPRPEVGTGSCSQNVLRSFYASLNSIEDAAATAFTKHPTKIWQPSKQNIVLSKTNCCTYNIGREFLSDSFLSPAVLV